MRHCYAQAFAYNVTDEVISVAWFRGVEAGVPSGAYLSPVSVRCQSWLLLVKTTKTLKGGRKPSFFLLKLRHEIFFYFFTFLTLFTWLLTSDHS